MTRDCCSCVGPQGPQGVQGIQGSQGLAGAQGLLGPQGPMGMQGPIGPAGPPGAIGPQGTQGLPGVQGVQGLQGVAGKDCDCGGGSSSAVYANIYASIPQVIGAYNSGTDTVLFDKQNAVSGTSVLINPPQTIMTAATAATAAAACSAAVLAAGGTAAAAAAGSAAVIALVGSSFFAASLSANTAITGAGGTALQANQGSQAVLLVSSSVGPLVTSDFDLSLAATTGDVTFLKKGVYHMGWQLQARVTTPVPNPVPSWSFGFWLDGILIPGSIYSGYTQAPGDDACHSTGDLQIQVNAGQKLRLRNTSVSSVNLNPNVTGALFPITIASINIEQLQSL